MLNKKIRKQKLNELRAAVGNSLRNARVEQKIMLIDAAEDLFCRARTLDSIECGTSSKLSLDALVYMAAYYDKVVTIHLNKYVPNPENEKSREQESEANGLGECEWAGIQEKADDIADNCQSEENSSL